MAQPARVLVVDDDPDFCEALRDRPEALRRVREEPPALVLLDLVLLGMDGIAVLETLRREEPTWW